MTEEQHTRGSVDTDALVTQTYREIADERVPEHLNRAILKEAATAARPRYSRAIAWTRPMAWAATIMLSVALVLEVTRVPGPSPVLFDDNAGTLEAEQPASGLAGDAPADALEELVAPAAPPGRSAKRGAMALPQTAASKATAKQAANEPALENRQRADLQQDRVAERDPVAPAASAEEFKLKDTDMLRRAGEMARMQEGDNKEEALASAAAHVASTEIAAFNAVASRAVAPGCDETASASPETWLECIVALEEAGLADESRRERELLKEAFPDFDPE